MTGRASAAESFLKERFREGGYVRVASAERRKEDGPAYHKGYEARLVLDDPALVPRVREALAHVGLRPGKPFRKHSKTVVPVYGRDAVAWFAPRAL